mmetsp:Transcript_33607/g.81286  ORF Transcript_33607/g.81286 Transcript_33607/m.81286 type:complete len:1009 (-) Transcript_33607:31-3057(-)
MRFGLAATFLAVVHSSQWDCKPQKLTFADGDSLGFAGGITDLRTCENLCGAQRLCQAFQVDVKNTQCVMLSAASAGTPDDSGATGCVRVSGSSELQINSTDPHVRTPVMVDGEPATAVTVVDDETRNRLPSALTSNQRHEMGDDALAGHGHGEHSTLHIALLFPFVGLSMGAVTLQIQSEYFHFFPYTSVLFVEGILLVILDQLYGQAWGSLSMSMEMWVNIDPHLLFYSFLPILVFADAFSGNSHLFARSFAQTCLLAGPGVLMGAFSMGAFGYYVLPYKWSFEVAMAFGAIMSATDPVAVVAILKDLGVSPKLRTLISGESLLNDGTAIVMFMVFHRMVQGKIWEIGELMAYSASMTLLSPLFGAAVGIVVTVWLHHASDDYYENFTTIQVSLTICIAYLVFIMAEGGLGISGVLSVVFCGVVMQMMGRTKVINHETMEHVWGMFEHCATVLIFLLGGMIFGNIVLASEYIRMVDFLWLILLYASMMAIRFLVLLLCFPILRVTGLGCGFRELVVLWWAGLRGSVGMALAILMDLDPNISAKQGSEIMFLVGGVAALTLTVNAGTMPKLLDFLEITARPEVHSAMLDHIMGRINEAALELFSELKDDPKFQPCNPSEVSHLVSLVEEHASTPRASPGDDEANTKRLREVWLNCVRSSYWELVHQGLLPRKSTSAPILLESVDAALDDLSSMRDWQKLKSKFESRFFKTEDHLMFWLQCDCVSTGGVMSDDRDEERLIADMCLSFMEAHNNAEEKLRPYFTAESTEIVKYAGDATGVITTDMPHPFKDGTPVLFQGTSAVLEQGHKYFVKVVGPKRFTVHTSDSLSKGSLVTFPFDTENITQGSFVGQRSSGELWKSYEIVKVESEMERKLAWEYFETQCTDRARSQQQSRWLALNILHEQRKLLDEFCEAGIMGESDKEGFTEHLLERAAKIEQMMIDPNAMNAADLINFSTRAAVGAAVKATEATLAVGTTAFSMGDAAVRAGGEGLRGVGALARQAVDGGPNRV